MNKDSNKIIKTLQEKGYEAYYVGGCVRDTYLGLYPSDIDVVTNASPAKLAHIFKNDGITMIKATSFLTTKIHNIDVATYRSETYTGHNGKPQVVQVISLEDDLSRRDITINAVAMDEDGGLIDPFNGIEDMDNKIIRFVGSPEKRILDDPCRILRALRFCALLGDGYTIEEETKKAIKKYKKMVFKHVPVERVRTEIIKSMRYEKPSIFLRLLEEFGILKYILPSLHKCVGVDGGPHHNETVFEHSLMCGDGLPQNYVILRLAGYLHDVGKPDAFNGENFKDHAKIGKSLVESDLIRLRFPSTALLYVADMAENHMKFVSGMKRSSIRRLIAELKEKNIFWKDIVLLKIADRNANLAKPNFKREEIKNLVFTFYNVLKDKGAFSVKDLSINGNDLMHYLNFKQGKEIGEALDFAFLKVLENPNIDDKFVLLDLIAKEFCK